MKKKTITGKMPNNDLLKLYQDLVETSQDLIFQCDAQGRFSYLNEAWQNTLGYNLEEMLGRNFSEFQSSEKAIQEFEKILKGETVKSFESVHIGKDGNKINFIINAKCYRNAEGSIKGIRGAAYESSINKNPVKGLQTGEEKFKKILNALPLGMHLYELLEDNRLVFMGANPAADRILGINNSQFIGKTIEEAFPGLIQTEVPQRYRAAALKGIIWQSEQVDYDDAGIKGAFEVVAFQTDPGKMAAIFSDISERKKVDSELRESEERFRTIFDSAIDGIVIADTKDKKFILCNNAFCAKTGYTIDEIKKFDVSDIHPEKDIAYAAKQFEMLADDKIEIALDIPVKRKDGSVFFCDIGASKIFLNGKQYLIGFFRDITDRKKAEEQLELMKFSIDTSFDGAYWMNKEGEFLYVNNAGCSMLGYTWNELQKIKIFDVNPRVTHERWVEVWELLKEKNFFLNESVHKRKDGTIFPVDISSTYVKYGDMEYCNGFARDISERKASEERLKNSESDLKKTQSLARIGNWKWNIKINSLEWSDEMFAIFGLDKESFNGDLNRVIADAIHPDDREAVEKSNLSVIKDKKPQALEYRVIWNDGTIHFVWASAGELILDEKGNPSILSGFAQDITERKHSEEERLKLEQQVQKAQKLESLGIFAGGIAHDFNNLLGGIYGNIALANRVSGDSRVSGFLEDTVKTIDRARSLTQQLLTFAKGGAPVKKFESLFPFIQDAINFALSGSNILCTYEIMPGLWWCNYDKNQIGQVIDNIVINSIQAMPMGGSITITASNVCFNKNEHTVLSEGNYVRISIADKGIGIPKEIIARIFDPFFTTKQMGSGLGLATSYSIINRHNGSIDVESEPGKGSTFHILLPASNHNAFEKVKQNLTSRKGSGKILLMDDEEVIRKTTGAILEMLGYECTLTKNGKEALEAFNNAKNKGKPFRAIILDLTVPGGMNGRETVLEIRKIDRDIPVFVSSGYADDPVIANPGEYGFNDSIAKPFDASDLAELLERNFSKSG